MEDTFQLGTGFPYELLLGDFTSRASSETTDSILMRKIKSYQENIYKILKEDIFLDLLQSSGYTSETVLDDIEFDITFEVSTPVYYTPEQTEKRFTSGAWTVDELRRYDTNNGQDLFDNDKISQEMEDKKNREDEQFKANMDNMKQKKKEVEHLKKIQENVNENNKNKDDLTKNINSLIDKLKRGD